VVGGQPQEGGGWRLTSGGRWLEVNLWREVVGG